MNRIQALLSDEQLKQFNKDGYLIERGLAGDDLIARMNQVIDDSVSPALAPVEYEADVHYPGAPESKTAPGGQTPRRLLNAYTRASVFREWANSREVVIENGGLLLIPGSHLLNLERGRLDAALFLRTDIEENRELIARAVPAELEAGDTLFFHCRTFHAAGQNEADFVKKSLVYTYHAENNRSIPETRSAVHNDIIVGS